MGEQLMIAKDVEGNNTDDTNIGFVKRKAHKKVWSLYSFDTLFGFASGVNKAVFGVTLTVELVKSKQRVVQKGWRWRGKGQANRVEFVDASCTTKPWE